MEWEPTKEVWEKYPDANWIAVDMDFMACWHEREPKLAGNDYVQEWVNVGKWGVIRKIPAKQVGDYRIMKWRRNR